MTSRMRMVVCVVLGIILFIFGIVFLAIKITEADTKRSSEVCKKLGTDPSDMIHIKSGHYLCVTKDGRVVGKT